MPKHVQWGEMPTEEIAEHSLAGWAARSDAQLDVEIEEAAPDRAVRETRRNAEAMTPRVERDETARWASEVEVVRACVAQGPPRAVDKRLGGSMGRALDRQALGTSGVTATSTRAYEPDLGSDHYRHAWRVWMTLSANERRVLTLMFADLAGPNDGGADRAAKTIQGHVRHGKASDAESALPWFAVMLPVEGASAATLVAIALGWAREDATRLERWPDAQAVKTEVGAARSKFKAALRRVELDASGESLRKIGDRLPSGLKPLLIPAASMREQERLTPKRYVATCAGIGATVDGVRQPCEDGDLADVRVETASKCPACGRVKA